MPQKQRSDLMLRLRNVRYRLVRKRVDSVLLCSSCDFRRETVDTLPLCTGNCAHPVMFSDLLSLNALLQNITTSHEYLARTTR